MDSNELRELIDLISRSNFASFELERDDVKLRVVKESAPAPTAPVRDLAAPAPGPTSPGPPAEAVAAVPVADSGLFDMISPIVGTFYAAPAEDAAPFVEIGSQVSKGQVLCIVEAMKVMNEIESDFDGEIVEIHVSNAQPVEYGELMFRLRPRA